MASYLRLVSLETKSDQRQQNKGQNGQVMGGEEIHALLFKTLYKIKLNLLLSSREASKGTDS